LSNGELTTYARDGYKQTVDGLTVAPTQLVQQKYALHGECRLVTTLAITNGAATSAAVVFNADPELSYYLVFDPGIPPRPLPVRVSGIKTCPPGRPATSCGGKATHIHPGQPLLFYVQSEAGTACDEVEKASLRIRLGLRFTKYGHFKQADLQFDDMSVLQGDWNDP
jgi:hypothetical protein